MQELKVWMDYPKLSIIIPCYNEEQGILNLDKQLKPIVKDLEKDYEIELILIDDGSNDNTFELLKQHFGNDKRAIIVKHTRNRNLGAALKTGFHYATGDLVAALDSDCTYHPELLKIMLKMMDKSTDIVTVSPYHPSGKVNNVPPYRIFLSKSVSKIYKILLNSEFYTYTAMVRIYRKKVIKNVKFRSNTFLGVTEIMIKSILKGYQVKELPATLNVRKFGTSKMRTLSVIGDHISLISRIFLHRLLGIKI